VSDLETAHVRLVAVCYRCPRTEILARWKCYAIDSGSKAFDEWPCCPIIGEAPQMNSFASWPFSKCLSGCS
jgi:hypothetical protein